MLLIPNSFSRFIKSVSLPKAEPFKLWLSKVASERLDELQDPELSIDKALEIYMTWAIQKVGLINALKVLKYERKTITI